MTWCSRMMKRAEVLIGEPKDKLSTSDPARAWLEKQNRWTWIRTSDAMTLTDAAEYSQNKE